MKTVVQVKDGLDDPFEWLYEAREKTYQTVKALVRKLQTSAGYLPAPAAVRTRLVFMDDLEAYVRGIKPWSLGCRGYWDLQQIVEVYVAAGNRESTVQEIKAALQEIDQYREMLDAR